MSGIRKRRKRANAGVEKKRENVARRENLGFSSSVASENLLNFTVA